MRALHQKKQREAEGLFLVQGRKMVRELSASSFQVEQVFATEEAARELGLSGAVLLPAHDLERMGTFEHGNEVVAVVRQPRPELMLPPVKEGLVLALDGISDPGNLGTLVRIADWFGAQRIWCSAGSVDLFNPKCVQASMGSVFRVPVAYGDLRAALMDAVGQGAEVFKAEASGENVFRVSLKGPVVLVLGSESHGLSDGVRNGPGRSVAVPRTGMAESLNVSAAAAALCMEFARQQG